MDEAATAAAIIAGSTIISVVQALKELGLPSKAARFTSMAVGAGLGVAAAALTSGDLGLGAAAGFVAGIGATASYAVVEARVEAKMAP